MVYQVSLRRVKEGKFDLYLNGRFGGALDRHTSGSWVFQSTGYGYEAIYDSYQQGRRAMYISETHEAVQHDWDLEDRVHDAETCHKCQHLVSLEAAPAPAAIESEPGSVAGALYKSLHPSAKSLTK